MFDAFYSIMVAWLAHNGYMYETLGIAGLVLIR